MTGRIIICGLGPDRPDMLTLAVADALLDMRQVVLRTEQHAAAQWLRQQEVFFETLDELHERCESFDELNTAVCAYLSDKTRMGDVVYAVPGEGLQDASVQAVLAHEGFQVDILPGLPDAAQALASAAGAGLFITDGQQRVPAMYLAHRHIHTHTMLVVEEIDSVFLASEAKLQLLEVYPQEHTVYFYHAGQARAITLPELDRQKEYARDCCLVVPTVNLLHHERFDMSRLVEIIGILRSPEGCPWDREQTHTSRRGDLIEEAYEVLEAIDLDDPDMLCEELGDLLLQVVLHAQIAQDQDDFAIEDVISAICGKMISRHAHVFGDVTARTPEEVIRSWDRIKAQERGDDSPKAAMLAVPRQLPALMRARKVLKRAPQPKRNARELAQDLTQRLMGIVQLSQGQDIQQAAGELLLDIVALTRELDVDAELALKAAVERFIEWSQ